MKIHLLLLPRLRLSVSVPLCYIYAFMELTGKNFAFMRIQFLHHRKHTVCPLQLTLVLYREVVAVYPEKHIEHWNTDL
jgi:hypothetical protein